VSKDSGKLVSGDNYDNQRQEWAELLEILNEVQLTEGVDKMVWALEKSGQYTTRSLYKSLTTGGMIDARAMLIWKSPIPLKVKNFMWMANHDRIQCGVQLKKKNGQVLRNVLFAKYMRLRITFYSNAPWLSFCGPSCETVWGGHPRQPAVPRYSWR